MKLGRRGCIGFCSTSCYEVPNVAVSSAKDLAARVQIVPYIAQHAHIPRLLHDLSGIQEYFSYTLSNLTTCSETRTLIHSSFCSALGYIQDDHMSSFSCPFPCEQV